MARFKVLGPYELTRDGVQFSEKELQGLWSGSPDDPSKPYRYAIGVYIIAVAHGDRKLPVYVGKSERGFAYRLNNHNIFYKIPAKYGPSIFIFLLALVTDKMETFITDGRVDGKKRKKSTRSIKELEFLLIGTCMKLNPDLLNKQDKSFLSSMVVPGFLNYSGVPLDKPAKTLEEMLGQKIS